MTAEKKLAIDMTAGPTEQEVDNREESHQHDENNEVWRLGTIAYSYLIAVHFKFPDDLDGHLTHLAETVLRPVDVAESTVAHLLGQNPPL